ncbi:unnamed protein product [Caenorhabditis angaria]|uniref:Radical SAM core domain-containing protein n=1 Tax=Caenorhabditis angaria TaxID=860376 RepID=A0A9P1J2N0_9PELO|nr:unnamed protein product [Caenorhabditis angaria]
MKKIKTLINEPTKTLRLYTKEEKLIAIRKRIENVEKSAPTPFFDMYMRPHNYLRISLTEKCNFRCLYCMPAEGIPLKPSEKMLKNEEIFRLVKLFAKNGVDKVRLTGGEPTIRKDLVDIVDEISKTDGIKQVGLTTNGLILHRLLPNLVNAGLTKINISIDSLNREKFAKMTRRDGFEKVWRSITMAQDYFPKVKLNVVVLRNQNDNEILDFIKLTETQNLDIRFIEFMPFGGNEFKNSNFVGYNEMLSKIIEKYGNAIEKLDDSKNDTTKAYKIRGSVGQFGFITSMSNHFCNTCNRLRITADGNLKVCLHGNSEVSLRDRIRNGDSDEDLESVIQSAVNRKKAKHAEFRNGQFTKPPKSSNDFNRRVTTQFQYLHNKSTHSNSIRLIHTSHLNLDNNSKLTHVNANGEACQVDVSHKPQTIRTAKACGTIYLTPEISRSISENTVKKGDVLTVAKIAGILGAKQVPNIIPLCHPIQLDLVDLKFDHDLENHKITVISTAKCNGNTGVEMEALMACTMSLLTIYDMCKAICPKMTIGEIKLIHKSGGKSTYQAD